MPSFTLRFYPVREADSRVSYQTGPARKFANFGEIGDFLSRLSSEARAIALGDLARQKRREIRRACFASPAPEIEKPAGTLSPGTNHPRRT
jgi:hypothetical protein